LRGRSGRQGDPGSSRFYLSLEDDLLRIFGGERIGGIMGRLGLQEGEPIEHGMVSRAIEGAQRKVEAHNFDIRKQLIEYDDVMNQQREVIYRQRREILSGGELRESVLEMISERAEIIAGTYADDRTLPEEWNWASLGEEVFAQFGIRLNVDEKAKAEMNASRLLAVLEEETTRLYAEKERTFGSDWMRRVEEYIMLQVVDNLWKDHLLSMDHLKEGIGLRGYAQQNPLIEYKREGYEMFMDLISRIKQDTVAMLFRAMPAEAAEEELPVERPRERQMSFSHGSSGESRKPQQPGLTPPFYVPNVDPLENR